MLNNPKLDVVNIINAYAKFCQNLFLHLQGIQTSFMGHNSAMNWRKWKLNNPKLDGVNMQNLVKLHQSFPKMLSENKNGQSDRWTDNLKTV